jgi:hypothetical protein
LIVISPKSEWWSSRKQKIANAGEDAGDGVGGAGRRKELLCDVGRATWKSIWKILKKAKNKTII